MTRIFVVGIGAVSPAGWGVPPLRQALEKNLSIPPQAVARPGWRQPLWVRQPPAPVPKPAFLAHPRVRRASPISLYAISAALEALRNAGIADPTTAPRLGLVMCVMTGGVQYSQRFYEEVLRDPATASPLLFPETVFNATASHLAVLLGKAPLTSTFLGDPGGYLQGLAVAADWLLSKRIDGCLVVGAEETNWLLADVLWHFDHHAILSGGAGAMYLSRSTISSPLVELVHITDPQYYSAQQTRSEAIRRMRRLLPGGAPDELLCDSTRGHGQLDRPELSVWQDWPGARSSVKKVLGEGLMAAAGWQCVAAVDALARTPSVHSAANISIAGVQQQAIGARFLRC